jgi:hypothetical protein
MGTSVHPGSPKMTASLVSWSVAPMKTGRRVSSKRSLLLQPVAREDPGGEGAGESRERVAGAAASADEGAREPEGAAAELLEVGVEEVGAADARHAIVALAQALDDVVGRDAVGEQRGEKATGADPEKKVEVAEAAVEHEAVERAQGADLVEQTLDAAAREAERDLAAALVGDEGLDGVEDVGARRVEERLAQATAARAVGDRSRGGVVVEQHERAVARGEAVRVVVGEEPREHRLGFGDRQPGRGPRVEQHDVDRARREPAQGAAGVALDDEPEGVRLARFGARDQLDLAVAQAPRFAAFEQGSGVDREQQQRSHLMSPGRRRRMWWANGAEGALPRVSLASARRHPQAAPPPRDGFGRMRSGTDGVVESVP